MSGNFVTVESRPHPAIGYDPCPGSVEGSIGLADQMRGFYEHTGELAAFLEGRELKNIIDFETGYKK